MQSIVLTHILLSSGLVFFWRTVADINGKEYSICLYIFLFGLALVDSVSNVLFLPFMARYQPAYLNAYFVGMGCSALIPSLLSLVQGECLYMYHAYIIIGSGNYKCTAGVPIYSSPLFGVEVYFGIISLWTVTTGIAFIVLYLAAEKRT